MAVDFSHDMTAFASDVRPAGHGQGGLQWLKRVVDRQLQNDDRRPQFEMDRGYDIIFRCTLG